MAGAERWRAVAIVALSVALAQGVRSSFGAFVPELEEEIGASRTALGSIAGLVFLVSGLSQPLVGGFADRVGPGRVLAAGLVAVGTGCALAATSTAPAVFTLAWLGLATPGFAGAATPTAAVAITRRFGPRSGAALGILASAYPIGQLAVGPLTVLGVSAIGWRATLGIDALVAIGLVAPLAWFGVGAARSSEARRLRFAGPRVLLAGVRSLWLLFVPYVLAGVSGGFVTVHFVALARERGQSTELIALAVGLLAGPSVVGALVSGWLTERVSRSRLLMVSYLLRASAFVLLLLGGSDATAIVVFAALSALVDFANLAPGVSLANERLGARLGAGVLAGTLSLCYGVGAAAGASSAGLIREVSGGYDLAIGGCIALLVASAALSRLLDDTRQRAPISFL